MGRPLLWSRDWKAKSVRILGCLYGAILIATVLAAGCGQGIREEQGTGTTGDSSVVPEETEQETTAEEPTEPPFTAAPEMDSGSAGAADGILGVSLGEHEGFERAVIEFGTQGDPAPQVPTWSLSSPTGEGYARILLPDVDTTTETDGTLGGSILDNFYVVRAPDSGVFVDIFATGAFQYRVLELSDPGRLVVDYRPASVDLDFPLPARSERTVLFEPREGETVTSPLRVSGYSRNFEASNTIMLRGPGGDILSQSTALSNDWLDTWGYFEASLEFPAFEGPAILQAGVESPRDGSFEGVEAPVVYSEG